MWRKRGIMSVKVGERHIPDTPQNRQLDACWVSREAAMHTLEVCANEKIFIPKFQSLTDKIVDLSIDIYLDVWEANNIWMDPKNPDPRNWEYRSDLQENAIRKCRKLLGLISLARGRFHLRGKKVNYWSGKVIEAMRSIQRWHESDVRRYQK